MQIRPMTPADLDALDEIDATIDSTHYLHIGRVQPEGEGEAPAVVTFSVEDRPLREPLRLPNRLSDDIKFVARQIATGADEGVAIVADHDQHLVAMLLAQPDPAHGTLNLVDLRVDYDYRRQGLGLAMLYQLVTAAREREVRAVRAEAPANNYPAVQILRKTSFELAGLDTHRHSNHDLVKEHVTLFWYAALD